jgi:hypothetical protein
VEKTTPGGEYEVIRVFVHDAVRPAEFSMTRKVMATKTTGKQNGRHGTSSKGGKEKRGAERKAATVFWRKNKKFANEIVKLLEWNFKEIARGEIDLRPAEPAGAAQQREPDCR